MNNHSNPVMRPRPAPLPATAAEWEKERKIKTERTLNDHIEDIHLALLASEKKGAKYNRLLDAVYDEDATEGSLSFDNFRAAAMIRAYAKGREDADEDMTDPMHDDEIAAHFNAANPYVARKRLATIVKALNVVLRRYSKSRNERARMMGGEVVPNGGATVAE